ncbi:hypothetical protein CBOM_05654 [Ceraceosorus bombacis]|uniref:Uncharacterized protein n=1 Tax=Ceraceosorus bombacis TaxID=401625 RepID=A0A0P1BRP7_9BASI|nr:hypothetical protein CBOM_05654 [Ceraceosorus bombacis]
MDQATSRAQLFKVEAALLDPDGIGPASRRRTTGQRGRRERDAEETGSSQIVGLVAAMSAVTAGRRPRSSKARLIELRMVLYERSS